MVFLVLNAANVFVVRELEHFHPHGSFERRQARLYAGVGEITQISRYSHRQLDNAIPNCTIYMNNLAE